MAEPLLHEVEHGKSFVLCSKPKPCLVCVENDDPAMTVSEWMGEAWIEGHSAGARNEHYTKNPYRTPRFRGAEVESPFRGGGDA